MATVLSTKRNRFDASKDCDCWHRSFVTCDYCLFLKAFMSLNGSIWPCSWLTKADCLDETTFGDA